MTITPVTASHAQIGGISGVMGRIAGAIHAASVKTGVDFSYLMAKASQESGMNAAAKAKTSSATGLFQFVEQTWLQMVKQHGEAHGIGALADKIQIRGDGRATVADSMTRKQILALRNNPELSAAMAAELAKDNQSALQAEVGGKIGKTELYLAHFLGAGGAAKFIQAQRDNPNALAANLLPQAAAANRAVFYKDGKPQTVAAIYDHFTNKMDHTPALPRDQAPVMLAAVDRAPMTTASLPESDFTTTPRRYWSMDDQSTASALGVDQRALLAPQSLFAVMTLAQLDVPMADVAQEPSADVSRRKELRDRYS